MNIFYLKDFDEEDDYDGSEQLPQDFDDDKKKPKDDYDYDGSEQLPQDFDEEDDDDGSEQLPQDFDDKPDGEIISVIPIKQFLT